MALDCTLPPAPVAVKIYVVVWVGATNVDPLSATLLAPREALVAFFVVHVSVTDCPTAIVVVLAFKLATGAGCTTVTVTDAVEVPPGPVAVNV